MSQTSPEEIKFTTLCGNFFSEHNAVGEILFRQLNNSFQIGSLRFKIDDQIYLKMKESGLRTEIIDLLDNFMSHRRNNNDTPYDGGIVKISKSSYSILWLNEGEITRLFE